MQEAHRTTAIVLYRYCTCEQTAINGLYYNEVSYRTSARPAIRPDKPGRPDRSR